MAKKDKGPEMMRRLSPRDIMGQKIADIVKAAEGPVELFTVYGLAMSAKTKETTYGPATAAVGQFEVIKHPDGEIMLGSVLYLPEPAGSALVEQIRALNGTGQQSVQFACTIGAKPSNKSATGYEYTWKPHLKPEQRSALDTLRGEVRGLLESPK